MARQLDDALSREYESAVALPLIETPIRRDYAEGSVGRLQGLAEKAHPAGETRLGSDLRWARLVTETDYLIRLWDEDELRACAWVTRRTVSIPPTGTSGSRTTSPARCDRVASPHA